MRNSIEKPQVLIMILLTLALTGCSSNAPGKLAETEDKSSEIMETAADNSVSESKCMLEEDDEVINPDDVDMDDPVNETDTNLSIYDEIEGTYYSEETVSDAMTGETVPKNCGLISGYEIQFYKYDQNVHCYRIGQKRRISETERMASGNLIEFYDEEDTSQTWTLSSKSEDPYYYDLYFSSNKRVDALISPKSKNFKKIFASGREFLLYPSENCTTGSLEAPKVNNGVNYLGPDYVSIHFNWNAVDGAEGYEVLEDIKAEGEADDRFRNPRFSEIDDRYYISGGQDDFIHRIKVRAFKTKDGRRVFSEWSPYAIGKESNLLVGESLVTEEVNDKDVYIPVLEEYSKVFRGDESLYGMRAPGELYYKVKSFDVFDINDFCYAFCDYGPVFSDPSCLELLILKKKEGKDCLYSLLYNDGSYPLMLGLDYITGSVEGDYSSTDLEAIPEGEDLFLYDNGIIAKSRDEKDFSVRNYIKLVNEPDMVPFHWELLTTIVRVTDSSGSNKYYKSDVNQSLNYYPNEKKDLYKEISENEFNKIQKKYEVPTSLVKYPFAEYKGTRYLNEEEEKVIDAYASVIKEKKAKEPFASFTLIHLDEDDIPELAIAYGGSHATGVGFYRFDETGVNEICATGSNGLAYYERGSGIAYGWYTGQGATWYNICIIKDGKLTKKIMPEIAIQYDENFKESGYSYYLEEEEGEESESKHISKEEFEKILAPYSPENRQYRELNYDNLYDVHKISDIKQALKDSLAEEDTLPQLDMEFFRKNTITGK